MKTTTHWMSSLWSKPAHVDGWLLALVGMLLAIGMMVIASSSIEFSSRMYGNPMAVLIRHVVYLSFGLVAALVVSRLPINLWHDFDRLFLLVGTVALIAVLIPGIGSQINGSWRWFRFGPIGVQPSEIMKWFMILFVAGYLARQRGAVKSFWGLMKPVVIMVFVLFLLLLEPDFGAAVVLTAVVMGMMFLGGANFIQFLGLAILGVMLIGVLSYGVRGIFWATLDSCNVSASTRGLAVGMISLIAYTPDIYVPVVQSWCMERWSGQTGYQVYYALFGASSIVGFFAAHRLSALSRKSSQ